MHLVKRVKVERRTDKSKVTKAEVHPKSPVVGERAGNYILPYQKAYLSEGSCQALKGKDDICLVVKLQIDKMAQISVSSAELNFILFLFFNSRICAELSLMDAKGDYTAHLYSFRSQPMIREENLRFDPGLAIGKECDPQFGVAKWFSQNQDLLYPNLTFSCMESLDSRGTMGKSYTAPSLDTASLSEDYGAYQRCLGDSWGHKADCDWVMPMAHTSPLPVKEGMADIVVDKGDKPAYQIIEKLDVFPYLIAWYCGVYAEPHQECYPVPTMGSCQEFDALKVEAEFEEKCERFLHYDACHTIVWEDYLPPGVVDLECGCPTCEGDQQGAVQGSHVCPDLLKIDEWDTMVDDYWGNAMDVATILDKKC